MRWTTTAIIASLAANSCVPISWASVVPRNVGAYRGSGTASPTTDFGSHAAASTDLAVNAFGDGLGYHIQVGSERSGFAWREVALLRPGAMDDSSWTGYQCTSGDGRYEAVAVLPTSAVNNVSALEHGAFAYSVDLATGKVRPIATGVALRYHSPGCGTGDVAAFSVSLGASEQTTEILTANLTTGAVEHSTTVAGELTSAVPVGADLVAALGAQLVTVPMANGAAKPTRLAATAGQAYELRPAADGGVDFLSLKAGAVTATLAHELAGTVRTLAQGPAATMTLYQGRAGHNTVVGASTPVNGGSPRSLAAGPLGSVAAASLDGDALFGDQQSSERADDRVLATTTGHVVSRAAATQNAPVTTSYSALVPAGVPAAPTGATRPAHGTAPAGDRSQLLPNANSGTDPAADRGSAIEAPVITPATAQTPACAVPRNNPTFQVMQPGSAQVDWAVQMAEQNLLTGSQYTRPANFDNMGLVAYAPNSDFAAIALDHPSSDTWNTVPRSVYEAILAQESNWDQASWHALPGIAGNPIIADYYGAAGSISTINYSAADCGYGIGQVTTGMQAGNNTIYSVHGQEKIAVDYQENIAAGLQILESTWNQLYTAGITINGGDPRYLENWYYAIWAYNTGIEPNAAHGNTTGCTPSPTCTGPDGTWGLGWANNPANPAFPPNRLAFLQTTYGDAAHPGNWPYQERVLGWMGRPLRRMNSTAYATPTYHNSNSWLQIPTFGTFCTTAGDDCTPPPAPPAPAASGTCTLSDSECWWHLPVTYVTNCTTSCATSSYAVGSGSSEPSVSDPHPPVCSLDTQVVPTTSNGAPIIVSAQVGLATGARPLNIVGCGSSQNWSNGGTFTYSYGTNSNGDPVGAVDTHQLGAGFGGYIMFTHTENGSNPAIMNTGTWTPVLPKLQYYKIKLHIPATGARATDVVYVINPGGGASAWKIRVNQDWGSDQWVTIGTFAMENGGNVQLSNKSSMTPGGYDVGYDAIAFVPQGGTPGTPIGGPPGIKDAPEGSNPAFVNCGCVARTAGDPVNTATGYYSESATDLTTSGRGMPLKFSRSYASAFADPSGPNGTSAVNGPFGYGWSYSYGLSAVTDPATGNVTIQQEDQSAVTFDDVSGTYTPSAPRFDATLVKTGGSYIYTRTSSQVFTFDATTGHLTAESDLAGQHASTPYSTKLAYNASGQLSTITDPDGHVYTLGWTGTHITSLTDSAGREVTYGYDSAGDLTDVYGVATIRTPSLQDNDHTTYAYNTTTHLLTGMRQPKYYGDTTTVPTPAMSMVYDSSERVTSQTDPNGHTTTFAYGPSSSPSLTAGQTLVTDPAGHETLDTYQNDLLVSETKGYGSSTASTTGYTYDPVTLGVSTITDPNGNVETFAYDDHGNKISESDALGNTTAYSYDALDDLTTEIDPLGVETIHGFDEAGHIATGGGTNTGALLYGQLTSETVTQLQQSAEIVDSNPAVLPSRTVNYYYDDAAHPADRTRVVDANGNTTTNAYDGDGNLSSSTDPDNNVTKYGYDAGTEQLLSKVTGNGVAAGVAPGCTPPATGCTTYAYDALGNLTATKNALGNTTTDVYDVDGNKVSETDAKLQKTTYTYDPANELTMVTAPDSSTTKIDYNGDGTIADTINAGNDKTTYTYDAQGRKLNQTDADNRTTAYTYDPDGDLLTQTNPSTQVTTYGYDADRRITSISYSDGSTHGITMTYNGNGAETSMTDATGTSVWSYDAFGEVVSQTDGSGAMVSYGYDNDGDQTSITYPGGSAQTVARVYDNADLLSSVTDWNSQKTSFHYDHDGNVTSATYPNGTVVNTAYDSTDALSSTGVSKGTTSLASVAYTRDNDGQVASMTPTGLPGAATTYTYTGLNQLQSATSGGATASYGYNAAKDPTTDAGSSQAFDAADQLCWTLPNGASTAGCSSAPSGATTYTYNAQGDRTGATPASGTASQYSYNQADQMTSYTGPGGSAAYTYNGNGRRATKKVGSTTQDFVWNDATAGSPLLSDGTASYVYGPEDLPIEQIASSGTLWFFHDALGTTRALLNSAGAVTGAYGYDAYGNVSGYTGTATTPIQFAAGYADAESSLDYFKARYYDPVTAQFLTVDPALATTHAAYTYVNDDPTNQIDPSGLCGFQETARGNQRSSEFQNWSDEELQKAYKDPNTSKAMKQKIQTELKARKLKGSRQTKDQKKPKQNSNNNNNTNNFSINWGNVFQDILVVVAVVVVAVVIAMFAAPLLAVLAFF